MSELFIGLMSGTSMDGIDAALVDFDGHGCRLIHTHQQSWPDEIRAALADAITTEAKALQSASGALHRQLGVEFANAALALLESAQVMPEQVTAIGSHGQTVWHAPDAEPPYSLQIGDPQIIADTTGLTVVADFRAADLAAGGQGAPLAPAFHRWKFAAEGEDRAVVNVGGIANVTLLEAGGRTTGFDTGPGNNLMDGWIRAQRDLPFDDCGRWAADGSVDAALLALLRDDDYFRRPAPKSTGFEYFNLAWLDRYLAQLNTRPDPRDVQATLCELTAREIAAPLQELNVLRHVAICGGGAYNADLLSRLRRLLPACNVVTTAEWGIEPDWVEAAAFAWLARQRLREAPSNLPAVTGASGAISLGEIFPAPKH